MVFHDASDGGPDQGKALRVFPNCLQGREKRERNNLDWVKKIQFNSGYTAFREGGRSAGGGQIGGLSWGGRRVGSQPVVGAPIRRGGREV